jgi:prepilin peptidase CpaA
VTGRVEKYFLAGAVICAVAGAVCDVRRKRIPNRLTYGSILLGLWIRLILAGGRGFIDGLTGGLACGSVFLLFFLVKGMGGGDVKLMAAVGAWAGLGQAVDILIATALAGGILAIGYMIAHRRIGRTVLNIGSLLRYHFTSGVRPHPDLNLGGPSSIRIPYALAIAVGCVYALGVNLLRG